MNEFQAKILDKAQSMLASAVAELAIAESEYQDMPEEIKVCRDYVEDCGGLVKFVEDGKVPAEKAEWIWHCFQTNRIDWRRMADGHSNY